MKKTPIRKKGKSEISKVQRKLWELCKQYTRGKYGNTCYTCRKGGLEGSNWHTGHYLPKASLGAYLKYDPRVLRPQCYHCNINLGGAGADYHLRLIEEEGKPYVNRIHKDRQITVKALDHYYKMIEWYQKALA